MKIFTAEGEFFFFFFFFFCSLGICATREVGPRLKRIDEDAAWFASESFVPF